MHSNLIDDTLYTMHRVVFCMILMTYLSNNNQREYIKCRAWYSKACLAFHCCRVLFVEYPTVKAFGAATIEQVLCRAASNGLPDQIRVIASTTQTIHRPTNKPQTLLAIKISTIVDTIKTHQQTHTHTGVWSNSTTTTTEAPRSSCNDSGRK